MTRSLVSGALAILLCGAAAPQQQFTARARALDGDTLAVDFRLLGIDAFERGQMCERRGRCWSCGVAAQNLAAHALRDGDATVRLTRGHSYGRPVAVVTVAGADLGERMIRAGLAIPQPDFLRDDQPRATRYRAAFAKAVAGRAGGFAGRWIEPARWRRGERLACET